jgi:membrane fusion protein, multidrug efflux system
MSPRYTLLPLLLFGLAACDGEASIPTATQAIRPVRVETVRLEATEQAVRYAAVVRPRIEADVAFRVGGKITERLVDAGARVTPGMALARLDPNDLELQQRAVAAQLTSARANATNARSDFQRYAQLRQGEWSTKQEYDRRRAVMESAEARVAELEAQLRVARNGAAYATLVADSAGIVTAALAEPGQVVAAGQPVLRVARLDALEVAAHIPEHQIAALNEARLTVELWALPGIQISGSLRELSPSADPTTRTYQARISLLEPPPAVQLGMTATLIASRPHDRPVARLPLSTLTQLDSTPAVWVVTPAGDSLELRTVSIAGYTGQRVIITAGLEDGETVVTAGVHKLDAQQKVRVWTEPQR